MSAPALTRPTAPPRVAEPHAGLPANAIGRHKSSLEIVTLYVIVAVPFLALAADDSRGVGLGPVVARRRACRRLLLPDAARRHRGLPPALHPRVVQGEPAAAARARGRRSMAIQGPVVQWVADHRRHHAFSDRDGDPHSPWRYGTDTGALLKGMFHAHLGWLFDRRKTNQERYAPDLLKDGGLRVISTLFVVWAFLSLALPAVIGGLVTGSWAGAWSAFFWAGLVRVALLHHVTWSINSVCHVVGNRPFVSRAATGRPTSGRWRSSAPASRGTTCTTPTRRARATASCAARSTSAPASSGSSRSSAGPATSSGPTPSGWPPSAAPSRRRADPLPPERGGARAGGPRMSGTPPRPRVRMTGAQRRQQLLDVGRELFGHKGYEATSIEEIAAHAEVSKPVVYEQFGSKDGLYARVVDREMHPLLDRFTSALAAPGRPRQLLERAALALLDYIEEDTDGFRVLTRDAPGPGGVVDVLVADRRGRPPGGAHPRPAVRRPRLRPSAGPALQPGPGRHGVARRAVVARRPLAAQGEGGRPPGEPVLQRPRAPRSGAGAGRPAGRDLRRLRRGRALPAPARARRGRCGTRPAPASTAASRTAASSSSASAATVGPDPLTSAATRTGVRGGPQRPPELGAQGQRRRLQVVG